MLDLIQINDIATQAAISVLSRHAVGMVTLGPPAARMGMTESCM